MPTFRKKPVEIEAFQLARPLGRVPAWVADAMDAGTVRLYRNLDGGTCAEIVTLEGTMRGDPDDWLICGVKGEIYPCKPDIFAATYEPAEIEA